MTTKEENNESQSFDPSQIAGIYQPRAKHGIQVHGRNPQRVDVKDLEREPMKFIALGLVHMKQQLEKLAIMSVDHSKPVDEYQVQSVTVESNPFIEVLPQYETPELIEAILVTGPAAATFSLQLGDRNWSLVMPASQFIYLSPLVLCLSRTDRRILTASGTGEWSLELMGHADTRGNLI